jgi:hypothetical protein
MIRVWEWPSKTPNAPILKRGVKYNEINKRDESITNTVKF